MQAHTFPTTQEIDVFNMPIIELVRKPMRAIYRTRSQTLDLLKGLLDVMPNLSVDEFCRAYNVTPAAELWIEGQLGYTAAQN